MLSYDRSATVAQIVTANAVAARVFQKHGIDYCCHGNVTVPARVRRAPARPGGALRRAGRAHPERRRGR